MSCDYRPLLQGKGADETILIRFRCPHCGDIDILEDKVIEYTIKGLIRAICPRCGCKGLIRWKNPKRHIPT